MHVATDIAEWMFSATRDAVAVPIDRIMAPWTATDRFGIVIREPFGSLGASLLLHAAALLHYRYDPRRRDETAQYPQLYAFHVGARFGDHSSFDVWPPRREVLVDDDPAKLIEAVNDRAITRLAIPDTPPRRPDFFAPMISGWTDQATFRERVVTAWAYGPVGHVENADIEIRSSAEELERMSVWALTPESTFDLYKNYTGSELVEQMQIGPSTPRDLLQWRDILRARMGEVPRTRRDELLAQRTAMPLPRTQCFRSLSASEALARI